MKAVIRNLRKFFSTPPQPSVEARLLPLLERIESTLAERLPAQLLGGFRPDASILWAREEIAQRYLSGRGIEIGAFNCPLKVPPSASVAYVDHCSVADALRSLSVCGLTPEDFGIDENCVVVPDIIDDGQCLLKLGDNSQDFVVANHVLEHYEDPIKGFKNLLRVTKYGGVVFLCLPDMRRCFDRVRKPTPLEHVIRDYEDGPAWSRDQAYQEFGAVFVSEGMDKGLFPKLAGQAQAEFVASQVRELQRAGFSIHFHAWTPDLMLEMFQTARRRYGLPFEFELFTQCGDEIVFVFRKAVIPGSS